ncbi:MAG TPA: SPOR domain-containing protein, partial [Sphingomonas sp.]|nr:SPOR domain-containing protein [Sphingomonas sp.]
MQPLPGTTTADRLAEQMRALGANPTDLAALIAAGELSLAVDDLSAAAALFARADRINPRHARVKAGMGSILVRSERPGEALRYFALADSYGIDPQRIASDRGFAYDLIGEQDRAQREYRTALRRTAGDEGERAETLRRYALSLGISGRETQAMEVLDPLLRKSDRGAWRARAFVLAMNGKEAEAARIATTMLPSGMAQGLQPFFDRLPALPAIDRAFAVHFGEVHTTPERLADRGMAPRLGVLAAEPGALTTVAVAQAAPVPARTRGVRSGRGRTSTAATAAAVAATSRPVQPASARTASTTGTLAPVVTAVTATSTPAPAVAAAKVGRAPMPAPASATTPASRSPVIASATPVRASPVPPPAATTTTTAPRYATLPRPPGSILPRMVAVAPAPTPTPTPTAAAPVAAAPVPVPATVVTAAPAQSPVVTASREPKVIRNSEDSILARIIAGLSIPATELDVPPAMRPPVRLTAARLVPPAQVIAEAKAKEARDAAARKLVADKAVADKKLADRKALADKKTAAAKKLADAQKAEEAKLAAAEKKAARANPPRIWVQVAGGANERDLPKAFAAVKAKAPEVF